MSNSAESSREMVSALLRPRSVAVVGASDRIGVGQRVVANLRALDFDGEHDALLQSFDAPGATMAYLKPHGFFHDVPARFLAAEMQRLYPFAADHGITRFQAASKA